MGCGEEGGWSPFVLTTLSCLVYISPFFPSPTVLILDSEQYSTSDIPLIEYIITTHTDMLRSHPYKYLSPIFYKHQSLSPKNVLWKHCFFFFFVQFSPPTFSPPSPHLQQWWFGPISSSVTCTLLLLSSHPVLNLICFYLETYLLDWNTIFIFVCANEKSWTKQLYFFFIIIS